METQKKIIGVTGGVGAGKSSVLAILREKFHARIFLADQIAHDLLEPGTEGLKRVTDALGTGFLREDMSVDRALLAELIFHDKTALETINSIIHPLVWDHVQREAQKAPETLVIVEAAVFDTAPPDFFDEIWYVYASDENRIRRLMESRGYTREKCESIMKKQDSEEQYRERCSRVIDNDKSAAETEMQLKEILCHEIC